MLKFIFSFLPKLLLAYGCMKWFGGDYQVFILVLLIVYLYQIYIWVFESISAWIGYFLKTKADIENHYADTFRKNNFPRISEGNRMFVDPIKYLDVVCRSEEFECETRLQAASIIGIFNWFTVQNEWQAKKRLSLAFESAMRKYHQEVDNNSYRIAEDGYDEMFLFGKVNLVKVCNAKDKPAR